MVQTTYPGVYLQELPSGVRTITGVATSVTAFIGYTARGLDHRAQRLFSFADFERRFGGLSADSELSYAVQQFFANGGGEAIVVRVPKNDNAAAIAAATAGGNADEIAAATEAGSSAAAITLLDATDGTGKSALAVTALSRGSWANQVVVNVDYLDSSTDEQYTDPLAFNLTITDLGNGTVESFANVTMDAAKASYVVNVVNDLDSGSQLVSVAVPDATAGRPVETGTVSDDLALADLQNDLDYTITVSSDVPAGTVVNVSVAVIDAGETLPTSVLGVCRLLERKLNLALKGVAGLTGATVRCSPSSSGLGVRITSSFADHPDASLTFGAGAPNDALAALQLDAPVSVNVGSYWLGEGRTTLAQSSATAGRDGTILPKSADLIGNEADFEGLYALEKVDLFNLLSIPDATRAQAGDSAKLDPNVSPNDIYAAAMTYCQKRRAFLLIDPPPEVNNVDRAADWKSSGLTVHEKDGAAFFPRLRLGDPLNDFQPRTFAPSGLVAGLFARTDASRGVWKAPAGTEATLNGVQSLVYKLTDSENGALNPLGLNCFRNFPIYGNIAWGSRTLVGADATGSEWKYVPVRRTALYIEESLYRGTKWVVFEPNDEPLWAQIRLSIGSFMQSLFRQGAFQGRTPREAYLVKCDKETTTQDDINKGIVNILVGFAPLKPAEFVIIKIQQLAGQNQT